MDKMHYYLTCEGKIKFVQKYPKQLDNKTGTDTWILILTCMFFVTLYTSNINNIYYIYFICNIKQKITNNINVSFLNNIPWNVCI